MSNSRKQFGTVLSIANLSDRASLWGCEAVNSMSGDPGALAESGGGNVRLFKSHQRQTGPRPSMTTDPVLVLVADPAALTFQIEILRSQGCDVVVCPDMRQIQDLLGMPIEYWSMLIIEIEGFGGISAVIGNLLTLRRNHPDLPVILASTRMPAHDFTQERLPICDVSLALPCLASDLKVAIQNALENNEAWQRRVKDLDMAIRRGPETEVPALAEEPPAEPPMAEMRS